METLLIWALVISLVIGVVKAINHIGSDRIGTSGPFVTFITVTILWPFV